MILDTNAISDLAEGNVGLLKQLRTARIHSLPVVVLGEYRAGLERSRSKFERQQWLARLENEMEVLDVTSVTAQNYAIVQNELRELGRPIPENDLWIASLARQHGIAVLSRDAHFDHVPGIVRVGW